MGKNITILERQRVINYHIYLMQVYTLINARIVAVFNRGDNHFE